MVEWKTMSCALTVGSWQHSFALETMVETEMGRHFHLHCTQFLFRLLDFQEWKILKFPTPRLEMECVRSINSNLFRRMAPISKSVCSVHSSMNMAINFLNENFKMNRFAGALFAWHTSPCPPVPMLAKMAIKMLYPFPFPQFHSTLARTSERR